MQSTSSTHVAKQRQVAQILAGLSQTIPLPSSSRTTSSSFVSGVYYDKSATHKKKPWVVKRRSTNLGHFKTRQQALDVLHMFDQASTTMDDKTASQFVKQSRFGQISGHKLSYYSRMKWSDKIEYVLRIVPMVSDFIDKNLDLSRNRKDFFVGGKCEVFDISWQTFRRWQLVAQYPELQDRARQNNLSNEFIDRFPKIKMV